MDDKTLKALKASIRKWDKNAVAVRWTQYKTGAGDCPLCEIFNTNYIDRKDICKGCPIYLKTGQILCSSTPYTWADSLRCKWEFYGIEYQARCQEAARDEAAFLRSLLPEGESA